MPNLDLTAGVGFVAGGPGRRSAEFVVQGKYLFREMPPNGLGVGLVAGFGMDPLAQATGERIEGVFAYMPLSLSVGEDRLILHGNLGWHFERDHDGHGHDHGDEAGHHALTWAARADVLLPVFGERFTLIGEVFGEDRLLPDYQVGLRTTLIPARLLAGLSWGGHTQSALAGAGWVVGVASTPPPFF
ncbi:MAG: hypothetical protein H0X65_14135 [Gemmatimonadetes bacterium]|nr:hypothetical protein [Gemmatimonadota bacterium]